ncbi:MAG: TRAP transporter TatT component family protein [Thermodesulfobacteriota bacterium]
MKWKIQRLFMVFCAMFFLSGCTSLMITRVVSPTVENLQKQKDVDLVCEGAPSFLLMIDSMLTSNSDDTDLLITATQAYGAYIAALDVCGRKERATVLSEKSREYGLRLLVQAGVCKSCKVPVDAMRQNLQKFGKSDVPSLFWGAYGWAVWLQYQYGSPAALSDFLRVEQIMLRVVELDEGYYHGSAHLFLGMYYGARSAMLGGKPEQGKEHFRRALELSERQLLATHVAYAQSYARTVFDLDLYRDLLHEVLEFKLEDRPDLYLANQVAKRQARQLLQEMELYF